MSKKKKIIEEIEQQIKQILKYSPDEKYESIAKEMWENEIDITVLSHGYKRDQIWKHMLLHLVKSNDRDAVYQCFKLGWIDSVRSNIIGYNIIDKIGRNSTLKTVEEDCSFVERFNKDFESFPSFIDLRDFIRFYNIGYNAVKANEELVELLDIHILYIPDIPSYLKSADDTHEKRIERIANCIVSGANPLFITLIVPQINTRRRNEIAEKTMELFTGQKKFLKKFQEKLQEKFQKGFDFLFSDFSKGCIYSENEGNVRKFVNSWLDSLQRPLKLDKLDKIIDVADKLHHQFPQLCFLIFEKAAKEWSLSKYGSIITEYNKEPALKLLDAALKHTTLGFAARMLTFKGWDPKRLLKLRGKYSKAVSKVKKSSNNAELLKNCGHIEPKLSTHPRKEPSHRAEVDPTANLVKEEYEAIKNYIIKGQDTVGDLDLKAFKAEVESQEKEPRPNNIYRGIGFRVSRVEEGLRIKKVYSPNKKRFTIPNKEGFIDPEDLKGKIITHVEIEEGKMCKVKDLSDPEIALAFHKIYKKGKVVFKIYDGTKEGATYSCKSTIFVKDSNFSAFSAFSALSEVWESEPSLVKTTFIEYVIETVLSLGKILLGKLFRKEISSTGTGKDQPPPKQPNLAPTKVVKVQFKRSIISTGELIK